MKKLLSAFLALLIVLTLLPVSALAATGTGIKPTPDSDRWTTRQTASGASYSYRPPLADNKYLYCMDLGYSYHYGTPSFLNSYTYNTASGALADQLWAQATAKTGLGEMNATVQENVKWMMSYNYKYDTQHLGDIPGSLFMALQTYIWDNQSDKSSHGDPSGDIDAGGFANADTYTQYVEYYKWLLAQKAKEDQELQAQVTAFESQGREAAIVEDESSKWAVLAISSVSGRQSFFAYHSQRIVLAKPADEGDVPPVDPATADVVLSKIDADTGIGLAGAVIRIDGSGHPYTHTFTTGAGGKAYVEGLQTGASYKATEISAPDGYVADPTPQTFYLHGEPVELTFKNHSKTSITFTKTDTNGRPLAGAVFNIYRDGQIIGSATTNQAGTITVTGVVEGLYSFVEVSAPAGYQADPTPHDVYVDVTDGSKTYTVSAANEQKPDMEITKADAQTGEAIPGTIYSIKGVTNAYTTSATTGADGKVRLTGLEAGVYVVREESVPAPYIVDPMPRTVALQAGKTSVVAFANYKEPGLEIIKRDAQTGAGVPGVTFHIQQVDGAYQTTTTTAQNGRAFLPSVPIGTYTVTEQAVPGDYVFSGESQTVALAPGQTASVAFYNTKKPSITVEKKDSITGDPIQGAKFSIWYAVSGSVSGDLQKVGDFATQADGKFTLTQKEPGWYRITETEPAPGYALKEPSTLDVFVKAGEEKVVTFENQPLNALIIKKVDATDGHVLQGAKFRVSYFEGTTGTGGTTIGEYTTSAQGTIVITGLKAGTYIVQEIQAPAGYIIANAPKTVYLSGKEQAAVTVEFANQPDSGLTITKLDSVTKKPLAGAVFEIRDSSGAVVGNSNGLYTTDESGTIHLTDLPTDTYVVKEIEAPEGYVLDGTPQTVKLIHGKTHALTFYNAPKGSLIIEKLDEAGKLLLPGATFKITTSSGQMVGNAGGAVTSNGLYITDQAGQIILTGLEPDTYVVTEVKAPDGYLLNETAQTVVVNAHDTQTLRFYNKKIPEGGLRIIKLDEETRQPIAGVEFEVTHMDGKRVGSYRTDAKGIISLPELKPGWYTVVEKKAADRYELDAEPRDIQVKDKETVTLEITNRKQSNIVIRKVDANTGDGLYGAVFVLYDSNENPIGEYTSDQRGYVYIDGVPDGRYLLREIEAPDGYTLDNERKTIYVRYGSSSEVRWENTAVTGQIQITKYAAEDNALTGIAAGGKLQGAVFEIVRQRSGVVVGNITTDARGVAASKPLPLGRYLIREVQAPPYYQLSAETFDVDIEYPGQIIRLSAYNKSAETSVTITKTGVKEVLAGSNMKYSFTIANNSNVALENFYWHDRIPTDATTAFSLTTGTYSQRLNYRILYKTNYNEYRVLASNLLTTNNYAFAMNALPLMAGEVVTDINFDFGTVPAGFQSKTKPTLTVAVSPRVSNGYQIINRADVGGKYQGVWESKTAGWVTVVRRVNQVTPTLPKTGF